MEPSRGCVKLILKGGGCDGLDYFDYHRRTCDADSRRNLQGSETRSDNFREVAAYLSACGHFPSAYLLAICQKAVVLAGVLPSVLARNQ